MENMNENESATYLLPAWIFDEEFQNKMENMNENESESYLLPAWIFEKEDSESEDEPSMMEDPAIAEIILLHCFEYLDTPDLLRASKVSRIWNSLASSYSYFWRTIKLTSCRLASPEGLSQTMIKYRSQTLDLGDMKTDNVKSSLDPSEFWTDLFLNLKAVKTLSSLSLKFFGSEPIDLSLISHIENLRELNLKFKSGVNKFKNIEDLIVMENLYSLSLESDWDYKSHIEDLLYFDDDFPEIDDTSKPIVFIIHVLLQNAPNLKKLRLVDYGCIWSTDDFLSEAGDLQNLTELELLHCKVGIDFESDISKCTKLKRLFLAPAYRCLYVYFHHRVISGVGRICDTLSHFIFGYYQQFGDKLAMLMSKTGHMVGGEFYDPLINIICYCYVPLPDLFKTQHAPLSSEVRKIMEQELSETFPKIKTEIVELQ